MPSLCLWDKWRDWWWCCEAIVRVAWGTIASRAGQTEGASCQPGSCSSHLSCTQHGLFDHCCCIPVCAVAVQCEHCRWTMLEARMHLDSSYVEVMCLCCQCSALSCKRHSSRPGFLYFILQPVVVCGVVSLCFVRGLNATMPACAVWFFWHQRCMAKIWQQDCRLWWMLRGVEGRGHCG